MEEDLLVGDFECLLLREALGGFREIAIGSVPILGVVDLCDLPAVGPSDDLHPRM
jgi:hypothetical protein